VDPTLRGLGLRSGAWGGDAPAAAPAPRETHEPAVDLARHPSAIVPALQ
jgi:hypothetical protein